VPVGAQDLSRLSALLDEALALEPEERLRWLASLPEPDRALGQALRHLFEGDGDPEDFLETLPRVPPADESTARAGDVVGPYRLIREIASGGMGSVWMAERVDGALHRQVALKLPRLAWGAGLAERMARERDIGAILEHPHIARLYDAGVDHRGRPFLAFEYIEGERIDAWCTRHELSTRSRLELFLQVAQAVAHAHARLVVHRDLKPSNVLVTADGAVHLLDFGIAKLLRETHSEETGLTQLLGQAMTPHYASPEQLRGEPVTVASDVYSLGVLLYELLTGQRPHDPKRASIAALEEAILQGEAPAASRRVTDRARRHALRGDVDAILAKALQREPGRRYATVDAMADDVRRRLAGEPVVARPATTWYRLWKFVVRARTGLSLALAATLSILVAASVSLSQAEQANEAAARANAVKDFVLDTFRVDAAGGPAGLDLRRGPREYLLQRGAELIDARFVGQPALQAELHGVVASLFDEMADFRLAETHAARRVDVLARGDAPTPERVAAAIALSQALLKLGRPEQGEVQASQALEWARDEPRLAILARLQLVSTLAAQGKAQALGAELERLDAQIARDLPRDSFEHAMALDAHATLAAMTGRADAAVGYATQAVAAATALEGVASARVLNLRWSVWRTLIDLGRVAEARSLGASIIADLRQLGGPRDSTAAFAEIYYTAFLFANDPGHQLSFEDAEAIILADREIVKARGCRGIADAGAWSDYFLGWLYAAWHDFDRAEPLLRQALARVAPAGDEPTLIPYAQRTLAWTWIARGDHAHGDEALQAELALMERRASPLADTTRASLAFSRSMQGHGAEALALLAPGPARVRGADPRSLELALIDAGVRIDNGESAAALQRLPAPDVLEALPGADGGRRGEALCATGRPDEGLAALRHYVDAQSVRLSPASPFIARARAVEGLCALAAGDARTAAALARGSRRAFELQPGVSPYFKQPLERLEGALATATKAAHARTS